MSDFLEGYGKGTGSVAPRVYERPHPYGDLYPGDIVSRHGVIIGTFNGYLGVGKHGDPLGWVGGNCTYLEGASRVPDTPERLRKRLSAVIAHRRPDVVIPWLP